MRATTTQRIGIALTALEGLLIGWLAMQHFSFRSPMFPAGIVETIVAIALLAGVALPSAAVRVMSAQILTVITLLAMQVVLLHAPVLAGPRDEVLYAVALILSFASITLIAWSSRAQHAMRH